MNLKESAAMRLCIFVLVATVTATLPAAGQSDPAAELNGPLPTTSTSRSTVIPLGTVNLTELAESLATAPPLPTPLDPSPSWPVPGELPVPPGTPLTPQPLLPLAGGPGNPPPPPPVVNDFEALPDNGQTFPPDTMGAVGPEHIMTTLNSQIRVTDRNNFVFYTIPLISFWTFPPPFPVADVFDPRIIYDPGCGRWFFTATANRASSFSSTFFAVSANWDPTGTWSLFMIDADAADLVWADYPTLGYSRDWVVIQVTMFTNAANMFDRTEIYAFDKNALCSGTPVNITSFSDTTIGSFQVPAVDFDNDLGTHFLLQNWNGNDGSGNGLLRLYSITGAIGSEVFAPVAFITTPNPWDFIVGNFAPQMGTNQLIDTRDARMHSVIRRNGTLYAAHHVFLPSGNPTRSAVQWWQLTQVGGILQFGRLDDATATQHYAYPSLAVNQANDMFLGFSSFSANQFASAAYSFRAAGDPPSTLRADTIYKTGEASYFNPDSQGRNRWGDYSHVVVDPHNDIDFWTIQEYAGTPCCGGAPTDRWGTWWARTGGGCAPAMIWGKAATTGPGRNGGPAMTYDSRRGRVVLFGGNTGGSPNGTWEWDGFTWNFLNPATSPTNRFLPGLAYDSARGVTVMFGGNEVGVGNMNDTWEWNGTTWTQRSAGGAGDPTPRFGHRLVYDAGRGVTVLYGGFDGSNVLGDTWEWNGSSWIQRMPASSPGPLSDHAMAYDALRGVTVLNFSQGVANNQTWEYDGITWTQRFPTTSPAQTSSGVMTYDLTRGVCVLYGGVAGPIDQPLTWEWDGANWRVGGDGAPGRQQNLSAAAYDLARRQMVLLADDCSICSNSTGTTWVFPDQSVSQAYCLNGTATGASWSWSIGGPGTTLTNLNTPGVAPGSPASTIAAQFASSIHTAPCPGASAAPSFTSGNCFTVTLGGNQAFALCVGAAGSAPTCCLPSPGCTFNPDITQIALTGDDCNGNLTDDAIDIAGGTSMDTNGNGIPDECEASPEPQFRRADVDADGLFNALLEGLFLLAFAFQNGPEPSCLDAADFDDDGILNGIVDGVGILNFGFSGGGPPAPPGLTCGTDPTADALDCGSYDFCP